MQPLRVEFKLVGPWAPPSYGVHFDGLVAHAAVKDGLRGEVVAASALSEDGETDFASLIADLPFDKYTSQAGWCWKASKLLRIKTHGQERRYMTAKTPVNTMARAIGDGTVETKGGSIIDTVRGIGKNSSLYYTIEHTEELHAYCIGDKDALDYLLGHIVAVGIKPRIGHGSLAQFEDGKYFKIVPDDQALTKWKLRNLPDRLEENMVPGIGTIHPPYWKDKSYCWMPCEA